MGMTIIASPKHANRVAADAALWTCQGLVALIFMFAGGSKLLMPLDVLATLSPLPGLFLRFLGLAEVAGALGLILPGLLRIRPGLTPIAAACLSVIVAGATAITLAGGDVSGAMLPLVTMLLSLFVVYGRSRLAPSAGRAAS